MIYPVILCGGSGTRLWPLSRKSFPKQFVPLVDNKSLLQLSLERVSQINGSGPKPEVICVASEDHRFLVAEAMQAAKVKGSIILEPVARNTAPAMALAALRLAPQDLLLFCPSDHHIPDAQAFAAMVQQGSHAARQGAIVTFGVVPSFPSTAYGYIEQGTASGDGTHAELDLTNQAAVSAFFEAKKPDQVYLAAAKVGGIHANNTYPAEFIYQNLMVEANVIHNGILFNHESPRRGETFVTRKITRGLANISQGLEDCLYMGNIDALRDWGHAKDYVRMQWMMLQQDQAEDFVIATGVQYSVRQFIEWTATALGMQLRWEGTGVNEVGYWTNPPLPQGEGMGEGARCIIKIDPRYFRPTEVETLLGDPTKAKEKLGWVPEITLDEMVQEMVAADLADAKKHALLKQHGYNVNVSVE